MSCQSDYKGTSKIEFEYCDEKVSVNYEAEYARLQKVMTEKEQEYQEKVARMTDDLIRYEREIQTLKAKFSVVELIFGK